MSDWERLWSDFIPEELRLRLVETSSSNSKGSKVEKEENLALGGKGKEVKVKRETNQMGDKKKTDLSKIKCFHCHILDTMLPSVLTR